MNQANQYYQYNPYMMQTQCMQAPNWAFSLDDYTDDSDNDSDSQPTTPVATVKPTLAKQTTSASSVQSEGETVTPASTSDSSDCDSDEQTRAARTTSAAAQKTADATPTSQSPRSQDISTCDPDSDAFSLGSDCEECMSR